MRLLAFAPFFVLVGCGGGGGRATGEEVPPPVTQRIVEGQLSYFVRGADVESHIDQFGRVMPNDVRFLTPTFPAPAPRIPVEIWTPDGTQLLAETQTGADGRYSALLDFGPGGAALPVIVRVRSQLNLPFGTVVRIIPNEGSGPYTHQVGPAGNPADARMEVNLTVGLDEGAGAYHIANALYEPLIAAKSGILADFPDIDICWQPNNGTVSSWQGFGADLAILLVAGGFTGDDASPRDVWDDGVLARLLGEYLLAYFIHDVAPDGPASDDPLVPSRAWREGFLDFFSCASRGARRFWDTEGIGPSGRVVRFFDIESFFDPALPPYLPNDPNVYQDPANVGFCSRFTTSEVLWDLVDPVAPPGDPEENLDQFTFPLNLTLRELERFNPTVDYPYLFELFDGLAVAAVNTNTLNGLLIRPEDQGINYPPNAANGPPWPLPFEDPATPGLVAPGFDGTLNDTLDTTTGNTVVGNLAQRYFQFTIGVEASVTLTADSQFVRVEVLDTANNVLAAGGGGAQAVNLASGRYVVRVTSLRDPQLLPYELRLQVFGP